MLNKNIKNLLLAISIFSILVSIPSVGKDLKGFDKEGYSEYGYDKNGYDFLGYNDNGFNKEGCHITFKEQKQPDYNCSINLFEIKAIEDSDFSAYQKYRIEQTSYYSSDRKVRFENHLKRVTIR
jgi:hypothetical protein